MTGTLTCVSCGSTYAIARGVPRLNEAMEGLELVAESFSFEWKAHHAGQLEQETVFGRTAGEEWAYFEEATGLPASSLAGKLVLDAGCGPGQLTRQISERGAATVI